MPCSLVLDFVRNRHEIFHSRFSEQIKPQRKLGLVGRRTGVQDIKSRTCALLRFPTELYETTEISARPSF